VCILVKRLWHNFVNPLVTTEVSVLWKCCFTIFSLWSIGSSKGRRDPWSYRGCIGRRDRRLEDGGEVHGDAGVPWLSREAAAALGRAWGGGGREGAGKIGKVALEGRQRLLPCLLNSKLSKGYLSLPIQSNHDPIIKEITKYLIGRAPWRLAPPRASQPSHWAGPSVDTWCRS
jgi:hypothetical protein